MNEEALENLVRIGSLKVEPPSRAGIQLDFIRPGRPVENSYVESFNGKLRDECLSTTWFLSLSEAQEELDAFRRDYNETRPHSSLGNLPPAVYVQQLEELRASCS